MAPLACQKRLAPAKTSCHAIPAKATVVQSFVTLVVTLRRRRYAMICLELTTVALRRGPSSLRSHRSSGFRDDGLFSSSQRLTRKRQTYGGKDEKRDD